MGTPPSALGQMVPRGGGGGSKLGATWDRAAQGARSRRNGSAGDEPRREQADQDQRAKALKKWRNDVFDLKLKV